MYPAVIVLCIAMIITIPISVLLIFAFFPLFFVVIALGNTMAGQFLAMKFKWNVQKRHYHFLIGWVVCTVLSIIPVVDFLVVVFISSLGWGVLISFLFNKNFDVVE
jgi:hypothetical protein